MGISLKGKVVRVGTEHFDLGDFQWLASEAGGTCLAIVRHSVELGLMHRGDGRGRC